MPVPRLIRGLAPVLVPLSLLLGAGCGGGGGGPSDPEPTYEELVAAGWTSLSASEFAAAVEHFIDAASADPAQAEPYSGLGWCRILLDDPEAADDVFASGASLAGSDAVRADLQAGWAFVASILKDPAGIDLLNFTDSNVRIAAALALESDWSFAYVAGIDHADLVLVQASNHFALGAFNASLAAVQVIDPVFDADVETAEGLTALAARIEELRAGEGDLFPVRAIGGAR